MELSENLQELDSGFKTLGHVTPGLAQHIDSRPGISRHFFRNSVLSPCFRSQDPTGAPRTRQDIQEPTPPPGTPPKTERPPETPRIPRRTNHFSFSYTVCPRIELQKGKKNILTFSEKVTPDLLVFGFLKQLCYVTGDLCYREVINKFNEKYPKTTISYVAIRKLVETGSSLNVKKKIRKYLDENDGASVLVFQYVF
jgi:hypothetical protein